MASLLKQFLGGNSPGAVSSGAPAADPDFADFATAASPVAPSHAQSSPFTAGSTQSPGSLLNSFFAPPVQTNGRPFTKWYRIWERVTIADFYQEFFIIPTLIFFVVLNVVGARWNKSIARSWAASHVPLLEAEYAQVGFKTSAPSASKKDEDVLAQKLMNEYTTYATGRQNVAWTDIKITLYKRFNPLLWFMEALLAFIFESMSAPAEKLEATTYCFDGKEKALLPQAASSGGSSAYDGFVWAVVHKDRMQKLRDERYDLSLTTTRDHAKLPDWATVMSESSEITDALLTPELIKAIESEGEALEALIISDMPIDAPKKLNELQPRKRITLTTKLPAASSTPSSLFAYFLRLPDFLVSTAHFRPEALRKIRATREEETRKIRKIDEEEKAEERKLASDKLKKETRERKLNGMSAEEQKKFLERERGDERKKGQKRMSVKA